LFGLGVGDTCDEGVGEAVGVEPPPPPDPPPPPELFDEVVKVNTSPRTAEPVVGTTDTRKKYGVDGLSPVAAADTSVELLFVASVEGVGVPTFALRQVPIVLPEVLPEVEIQISISTSWEPEEAEPFNVAEVAVMLVAGIVVAPAPAALVVKLRIEPYTLLPVNGTATTWK
jgi:hypothetical protein